MFRALCFLSIPPPPSGNRLMSPYWQVPHVQERIKIVEKPVFKDVEKVKFG